VPFEVVSGVGGRMGVLDWGDDRRKKGTVLGVKLRRSINPLYNYQWSLCDAALLKLL